MEWFFVCLIVVLVLLFLVFFPIFFSVEIYVDVIENKIKITLKLFFIPVKRIDKTLFDIKTKEKHKTMNLKFFNLFKTIKILSFENRFSFGYKNNAYQTAMICGVITTCFCMFKTFLNNYKNVNAKYEVKPKFYQNEMNYCGKMNVVFLPIVLLICYMKTKGEESGK